MKDIHTVFTQFKEDFPQVHLKYEDLGQEIHLKSGPLSEKTRWLIKLTVSASSGHHRALETHLAKSRKAGVTEDEIKHALLLLIPTCGFPAFMEAYRTYQQQS